MLTYIVKTIQFLNSVMNACPHCSKYYRILKSEDLSLLIFSVVPTALRRENEDDSKSETW